MGAFTDMLLPDKGSGEEREKANQNDEGDPLPGTARHREFYPEGVADILKVSLCCTVTWLMFVQLQEKKVTVQIHSSGILQIVGYVLALSSPFCYNSNLVLW